MKKAKVNVFLTVFASEFVEIISDLNLTTNIQVSEEGHTTPVDMPLTVTGFVMDVDDLFVYLSHDGENVNQALPILSVKHVAIVDINAKMDEALDEFDLPDEGSEYH